MRRHNILGQVELTDYPHPSISADGRSIAFESYAKNLVPGDTNDKQDVFIRDMLEGTTELISVASGAARVQGNWASSNASVSACGHYVAFDSEATNLVVGDTNARVDVFVRDRRTGTTTRASVAGGTFDSQANDTSRRPSISASGRSVAFESLASNLVPGDSNGQMDIFVRDLISGTTERASTDSARLEANARSEGASLSRDGGVIVFTSSATNLVAGETFEPDAPIEPAVYSKQYLHALGGTVQINAGARTTATREVTLSHVTRWGAPGVGEIRHSLDDGHSWTAWTPYAESLIAVLPGEEGPKTVRAEFRNTRGVLSVESAEASIWLGDLPESSVLPHSISGSTRYATAVAGSKAAFERADAVVIATAGHFADALGGAALAGALDGPLLLTQKGALPAEVAAEIKRLGASEAYILGGTGAISDPVATAVRANLGGAKKVTRIAGANRYQTADRVAAETIRVLNASGGFSGDAFVATGANFPDALGASPVAAAKGMPVFLADPARTSIPLPSSVKRVWITGGTAVVSPRVQASLGGRFAGRLAGGDRFATAAAVARFGVGRGMVWNQVGITTGMDFPDALAAGPVLGSRDAVMLLTDATVVPRPTRNALDANKALIDKVTFFGGDAAVPPGVRATVNSLIK